MAAYAAVVSLVNLLEQIQLYHTRNPIFLDHHQTQLDSITVNSVFLQDFLENYSDGVSREAECLESQIADAVYEAEDLIDSYMADEMYARSVSTRKHDSTGYNFFRGLKKVIENMNIIQREAEKIKESHDKAKDDKQHSKHLRPVCSYRPPVVEKKETILAFGDGLSEILEKLTRGEYNRQIIPITGMGGIGKTTLAKTVYDNPHTTNNFDIRGWITVSQEFDERELLFEMLHDMNVVHQGQGELEYHELGTLLHKHLYGRRYLIVIDDIWKSDAWDNTSRFFPDNGNRSRIIITTRQSNLANSIDSCNVHKMNLLNADESWSLLETKVFPGQTICPGELVKIGKRIAENCRGLPLSIVVIAGILVKNLDQEYWNTIAEEVGAIVNSDNNEQCLRILETSYRLLPVHLKPCFLYLGVFPEDVEIFTSELTKLWVAEGFLKPQKDKTLEEVADDYLRDLIDRNLLMVAEYESLGNVRSCKIHDILRDMCLKEDKKMRFLYVTKVNSSDISQDFNVQRRVSIHTRKSKGLISPELKHAFVSVSSLRSLICDLALDSTLSCDFKLLRVWSQAQYSPEPKVISKLVNARYLGLGGFASNVSFPSINLPWNLQTITIACNYICTLPSEMWELMQLRHVMVSKLKLEDPCIGKKDGEEDDNVLENLQTLQKTMNFRCSKNVLRKIPNVRALEVEYQDIGRKRPDYIDDSSLSEYLRNLGRLKKLESLNCTIRSRVNLMIWSNLDFSQSLRKLTLIISNFHWRFIGEKIGSLPNLEQLTLRHCDGTRMYSSTSKEYRFFEEEKWSCSVEEEEEEECSSSVEGLFPSLKIFEISIPYLESWTTDSSSFACLEHLVLRRMENLEEIPPEIGELPTLQSIELTNCSSSANESALRILEYQRSYDNEDFVVTVNGKDLEPEES